MKWKSVERKQCNVMHYSPPFINSSRLAATHAVFSGAGKLSIGGVRQFLRE